MLKLSTEHKVYISNQLTDMRKSINGLSVLVEDVFKKELISKSIFIFFGKTKDKVKILFWEKNGYVVYYKRLCKNKFKFYKNNSLQEISLLQLEWLLAGLDYNLMDLYSDLDYSNYY